jgi:hypothetical protein
MIESAEEFLRLMRSENKEDYERFRNEGAPIHVWETLMSKYPLANAWIVRNRKSPLEVLEKLADDESTLVRAEVASARRISEKIQLKLAHDPEYSVRHSLAYNKKATTKVLTILSNDVEDAIANKAKEQLENANN